MDRTFFILRDIQFITGQSLVETESCSSDESGSEWRCVVYMERILFVCIQLTNFPVKTEKKNSFFIPYETICEEL